MFPTALPPMIPFRVSSFLSLVSSVVFTFRSLRFTPFPIRKNRPTSVVNLVQFSKESVIHGNVRNI